MRLAKPKPVVWAAVLTAAGAVWSAAPGSAASLPPLAVDKAFGKVAGWSIGYSDSLRGCLAAATYQDGTTVWFGFGGENNTAYIALTNGRWQSLEPGRTYNLEVRTRGRANWRGEFVGIERSDEKGLFAAGLKERFVIDLAKAGGMVVSFERRSIASLSLSGSADALDAVLGCQKEYVIARARSDGPAPAAADRGESARRKTSQGTGFFVSETGHVMTNNHVIDGCSRITVTQPGMPPAPARLVANDAVNDLAVLSTDLRPSSVPPLSMRARIGESVYVYGFPLSGVLASTGNFTIGNVTATAGLGDDTRMVQISAPVQPGNSGGPLVDQYGNVVGVIVSKLNVLAMAKITEDVAQNVNFAIKTTIALNFLEANGVSAPIHVRTTTPMDATAIAEKAKEFTVRINCSG